MLHSLSLHLSPSLSLSYCLSDPLCRTDSTEKPNLYPHVKKKQKIIIIIITIIIIIIITLSLSLSLSLSLCATDLLFKVFFAYFNLYEHSKVPASSLDSLSHSLSLFFMAHNHAFRFIMQCQANKVTFLNTDENKSQIHVVKSVS